MVLSTRSVMLIITFGLLLSSSFAIESFSEHVQAYEEPEENDIQTDAIIQVGAGSYTDVKPERVTDPQSAIFKTSKINGPVPTNDWISSVLFDKYSQPLYAHPLAFRAVETGFEVSNPQRTFGSNFLHDAEFTVGSTAFNPVDAKLDAISDWFATIKMEDGNNHLQATIGHGSPFAYFKLNAGSANFTFDASISVFYTSEQYIGITTSIGNHFGLFAPEGSSWTGVSNGSTSITIDLGEDYFSLAALPDNTEDTLTYFGEHAFAFVIYSKVSWEYNGRGLLVTTYDIATKVMEGTVDKTIWALYPHQWRDQDLPFLSYSYQTVRGLMKTLVGKSFETNYTFSGILPIFPNQSNFDQELLSDLVDEGVARINTAGISDTYWGGKEMGRLAQLLPIAEQVGNTAAATTIFNALKTEVEGWLTADGGEDYYYNSNWGTLIGTLPSFGSDKDLNDHHFHYGYLVQAAAAIALRDPDWAGEDQWGGMVKLIIRDYASPFRDDPMFPMLRNFDMYAGHSWASGSARFLAGNNQESSSEAINSHAALILWGELTGDTQIRDTGIYLYATEIQAINNYWFDIYGDVFHESYDHVVASLIWGGEYRHSTWFSGNAKHIHGIQFLPITPASIYLGMDPDYVQLNYDEAYAEADDEVWSDLFTQYLALSDPQAAIDKGNSLNMWQVGGDYRVEEGDDKAHSYHWVHTFANMGLPDFEISSDFTFSNVFKKGDVRNYVAYNPHDTPLTVTFSDGFVLADIAPNTFATGNYSGIHFSLTTSIVGSGTIEPASGEFVADGVMQMIAIPAPGWQFDHWEGDLTGSENPSPLIFDGNKSITAVFVEEVISTTSEVESSTTDATSDISSTSDDSPVIGLFLAIIAVPAFLRKRKRKY